MKKFNVYISDTVYIPVKADDFILEDDKVSFISSNCGKKKIVAVFTVANIAGFKEKEVEKND